MPVVPTGCFGSNFPVVCLVAKWAGDCHNDRKTPIRVEEMTSASVCQYIQVLAAAFVPLGATEGRAT